MLFYGGNLIAGLSYDNHFIPYCYKVRQFHDLDGIVESSLHISFLDIVILDRIKVT